MNLLRPENSGLANKRAPLSNLAGYHLILASQSPRRKELLQHLGLEAFAVKPIETDESFPSGLTGEETATYIAEQKAEANRSFLEERDLMITADTIVYLNGQVLGKPADREDAFRMLRLLSGKEHQVFTGVCLSSLFEQRSFVARTDVTFSELTDEEILWYIDHFHPYDKAGAYGIQEWIGAVAVERITGSYFNVMGLPVHLLYEQLKSFPALEDDV